MKTTKLLRSLFCLCLTACLCLALLPVLPAVPASAESYFDEYMDRLVSWGILNGYEDGSLRPDDPITRAEFAAMVNRAYGFSGTGPTPFTDVPAAAWYADDIAIAYNAGFFEGDGTGFAFPNAYLTREAAMVLLARNLRLESIPGEVTEFSDGRDFSYWSRGYVKAAVQAGLINGYGDGTFRPQQYISRGEMAAILSRALGTLVNAPGATTLGNVYGNVTLNQPGSTLQDTTIAGDLIISGGLGLESVTLDNVRVLGNIVVAGGGESNAGETIVLRNVAADRLILDSIGNKYIALRAEGDTLINLASLRSNAYVMDHTQSGFGLLNISLDGGNLFTLAGNLENVVNRAAASELRIGAGSVQELTVDETATGARLVIDKGAAVRRLNLDTGTAVSGQGDVGRANINTAGSSTEMLPDDINIRPGLTSSVAGTEMDSTIAQESSSEPRLLAGYPEVGNLAPTSAAATFSTNKAGTVYWAVSTIADGSIGENDLINPPTYATKIVKSGNIKAAASNTEYKANISGLARGGNYYLSAILVDSRGARSPVKVVAFTTPDDTAPNFTGGTPKLSLNKFDKTGGIYAAQVMVIPNKTCRLYWALYASGASAPTATEFRTGNLGGALAHNVVEVTRNEETYVDINNFYTLQEKTEYIIYLWLNDADNGKSSAVRNIKFTTVDGTPPYFTLDLTQSGTATATSIPLRARINEDGTIYVLALGPAGEAIFPEPLANGAELTDEIVGIQIEKAANNGKLRRVASAKAKADMEVTFNVSGLQAETSYDIWYIAKDTAGNYSAYGCLTPVSTLDTHAPTVTQNFTDTDDYGNPYAEPGSDIQLIFNENIQFYDDDTEYNGENLFGLRPLDLYAIISDRSVSPDERNEAREKLAAILRDSLTFYAMEDGKFVEQTDRIRTSDDQTDWYIDYRNVKVGMEDGQLIITFPCTDDAEHDSALNLNSGSTYKFEIKASTIADTAKPANDIKRRTELPQFTTVSAQVLLKQLNVTSIMVGDSPVAADLVFSMEPLTANVSEDLDFDVLFWSDTSIKFVLYRFDPETNLWSPVTVKTDDSSSATEKPEEVEIINTSNGKVFLGRSLYYDFEQRHKTNSAKFPYVVEELKETRYAIHFTDVDGEPENRGRDGGTWNADLHIRVSVVTGMTPTLSTLAQRVTAADLETAKSRGVVEIQTPSEFDMPWTKTNSTAPMFDGEFPKFTAYDTSVQIDVVLDRPGTLYYVVAPASTRETLSGNTKIKYDSNLAGTTNWDDGSAQGTPLLFDLDDGVIKDGPDPESGQKAVYAFDSSNKRYVPAVGVGAADERDEFYLKLPTSRAIYDPNFKSDRIKYGSVETSGGVTPITVRDLQADTLYLVYFVTQGTGQVYSNQPMLYQFSTEDVFRPDLQVERIPSSTVDLWNYSDGINVLVNYAVFQLDNIGGTSLGENFVDDDGSDSHLNDAGISAKSALQGMKVWEAIEKHPDGYKFDSYFDLYASDTFKRTVAREISTGTGVSRLNGGSCELGYTSNSNMKEVDCDRDLGIRETVDYFFAAIAWYNDPTSTDKTYNAVQPDSVAFRGTSPIFKRDADPPKLVDINGSVTIDYTPDAETEDDVAGKPPRITGYITLRFDKDLYYQDTGSSARPAIVLKESLTDEESAKYMRVDDLVSGQPTGFGFKHENGLTPTREITLTVSGNYNYIAFSGNLCSDISERVRKSLSLRITCPDEFTHVDSTAEYSNIITISNADWLGGEESISIMFNVIGNEKPTSISLSATSLVFTAGDEKTQSLIATVFPAGVKFSQIEWTTEKGLVNITNATGNTDGTKVDVSAKSSTVPGEDTITATVIDMSGNKTVSATCRVTVNPVVPPATPSVSTSSLTLARGATSQPIMIDIEPAGTDAVVKIGQWKSSDDNVAAVSATLAGNTGGTVKGVSAGTATITVDVTVDGKTYKLTCDVTVIDNSEPQ